MCTYMNACACMCTCLHILCSRPLLLSLCFWQKYWCIVLSWLTTDDYEVSFSDFVKSSVLVLYALGVLHVTRCDRNHHYYYHYHSCCCYQTQYTPLTETHLQSAQSTHLMERGKSRIMYLQRLQI